MLTNKITPLFHLKNKNDIIFLDIEADSKNRNLLQFGAIKLKKNKPFMVNWYCNPIERIPYHVLNLIGRDSLRKIKMGDTPHATIEKIYKLTNNAIFVSFGDFDYILLNELSQKYLGKKLNTIFVNFQEEWRNINKNLTNISLVKLANLFEIEFDEENLHDAFFDARIMYQIFKKWDDYGNDWVSHAIFNYNDNEKKFLQKEDIIEEHKVEKDNGYILFESIVKKITLFHESREKSLLKFSMIATDGKNIVENWSEDFTLLFDDDDYVTYKHTLIACLRRFVISTKDKIFYIFEHQRNDLIFLKELCKKYLNKNIGNEYLIINGIEHYVIKSKEIRPLTNILNKELVLMWDAILLAKEEKEW